MSDKPVIIPSTPATPREAPDNSPKAGQWFWVRDDKEGEWLGCVTRIGSNYFKLSDAHDSSQRIHVDNFSEVTRPAPDAAEHIAGQIEHHRGEMNRLMAEVQELTRRLAISPDRALPQQETAALVVQSKTTSMTDYKNALVLAKETTLPDLFKKMEGASQNLAAWMKIELLPLQAEAGRLKSTLSAVNDRIFNVELYAGLVETVTKIRNGKGAAPADKIYLMQRRHYMDEECLANYEAGGMVYKDLAAFEKWLCKKDNFERILPHSRCIVAFQVRRREKEREMTSLSDFFRFMEEAPSDKFTFLYMRNGEQCFQLATEIDFEEKLFPDLDRETLTGKLYARKFGSRVEKNSIISEAEYLGMVEDERREEAERKEKLRNAKEKDRWQFGHSNWNESEHYIAFDKDTVYFDDIADVVGRKMQHHNRVGLILQGLLDRSPVFMPHPTWSLYTPDGFSQAIELVYDNSRALAPAELPDFEAYRARLNASLKVGDVTVGQEDAWERAEAVKECARLDRSWRRSDYRPTHFTPYGNPGPGLLATVAAMSRDKSKVSYEWTRQRQTPKNWRDDRDNFTTKFSTATANVLNVSAYRPGDFKIFFADPRTRAEYLKWAPLLLVAEDYHAGKRKSSKNED